MVKKNLFSAHSQKGATLFEFAASVPFFLLFLIMGLDLLRVGYAAVALQYGTSRAARYASLMQSEAGYSREDSIRQQLARYSGIDVSAEEMQFCERSTAFFANTYPLNSVYSCISESAGYAGEWVRLNVQHRVPLTVGGLGLTLTTTVAYRNEPNLPSVQNP